MDLGLKDRVVVVTGSSRGIGRAIASAFACEGCRLTINGRHGKDLEAAAAEMRGGPGTVDAIIADVTTPEGCRHLIDETVARCGTIHVLVNNTGGIGRLGAFAELTDQEWLDVFNLNVMSAVRVTRAALPHMQKQKWGRIINISSESGTQPDPVMPHYNAAKAAITNLTKSLSKAYAGDNILVNTVSPSLIRTELVEQMFAAEAKAQGVSVDEAEKIHVRGFRPNILFGRAGRPRETAGIVLFLASNEATFITGSNFRVDGGSVASI